MMNSSRTPLLMIALLFVSGCGDRSASEADPPDGMAAAGRSVAPEGRETREIGTACMVESVNGQALRGETRFTTGEAALFKGWATTSDPKDPVPPIVEVILRSRDGTALPDVHLMMERTPRPDIEGGDGTLTGIGFEGLARLPDVEGAYEVHVIQETPQWRTICHSPGQLVVHQPGDG